MKYVLLLILLCKAGIASAQQQILSVKQIQKPYQQRLLKPLPQAIKWLDNEQVVFLDPATRETFSYNINTGKKTSYKTSSSKKITVKNGDVFLENDDQTSVQLTFTKEDEKNPTFSPDSSKIAFTRSNDLYVLDLSTMKEERMTFDGSDVVYNGYASWVYYEEILGRPSNYKAFWWSPDNATIAFMRFDDSKVPVFPLYNESGTHGYSERTRYPKAGDENPTVKMGIINIFNKNIRWAEFPENSDQYFGTPFWHPDGNNLWMQWMNRRQDSLMIYSIDKKTGNKKWILTENQPTWVDWKENIFFEQNNSRFFFLSDRSGWNHIYEGNNQSGKIVQITIGNWTVKTIESIDEKNKEIYFTARKENSTRFDFYKIGFDGKKLTRLSFGDYTHNILLSPDRKNFVTRYSNIQTPDRIATVNIASNKINVLYDNKGDEYNSIQLAKTELIRVPTHDGFELPLTITWPVNLDSNKKYPVLISIYGGPDAGTVYDSWKGINQTQWWAQEGLIQVAMDHRASGHFGKAGMNFIYRNLGDYEIKDYTEAVKFLIRKPFIDKDKIAITGFSYGGYITCLALTKASEYFKYGIAGGSVTDWKLYDSHYTERFMDEPKHNKEGYEKSAVWPYIEKYKGMLYIVHGTMDDNVHMQNSLQLAEALQKNKKEFMFMLYPQARHGWRNLPDQWAHFNNEKARFYYRFLLNKPVNESILE